MDVARDHVQHDLEDHGVRVRRQGARRHDRVHRGVHVQTLGHDAAAQVPVGDDPGEDAPEHDQRGGPAVLGLSLIHI